VLIKFEVFWYVTHCRMVNSYQRFEDTTVFVCLLITNQLTDYNISEDHFLRVILVTFK
jgi:hypothetical protein